MQLDTRIDCVTVPESILAPNCNSGADYLPEFGWGSTVPAGRPHTNLKIVWGQLCIETSIMGTLKTGEPTSFTKNMRLRYM
jgi:hypothetical protein